MAAAKNFEEDNDEEESWPAVDVGNLIIGLDADINDASAMSSSSSKSAASGGKVSAMAAGTTETVTEPASNAASASENEKGLKMKIKRSNKGGGGNKNNNASQGSSGATDGTESATNGDTNSNEDKSDGGSVPSPNQPLNAATVVSAVTAAAKQNKGAAVVSGNKVKLTSAGQSKSKVSNGKTPSASSSNNKSVNGQQGNKANSGGGNKSKAASSSSSEDGAPPAKKKKVGETLLRIDTLIQRVHHLHFRISPSLRCNVSCTEQNSPRGGVSQRLREGIAVNVYTLHVYLPLGFCMAYLLVQLQILRICVSFSSCPSLPPSIISAAPSSSSCSPREREKDRTQCVYSRMSDDGDVVVQEAEEEAVAFPSLSLLLQTQTNKQCTRYERERRT